MRLHQNDLVALQKDGDRLIARVVKFRQSGQVNLAPHSEAGDLKRRDGTPNEEDPFKYLNLSPTSLKASSARKIRVDESGRVFDPGPPKD